MRGYHPFLQFLQVYYFYDAQMQPGVLYIGEPPAGLPLAAVLSQAISRILNLPVVLPLDCLFAGPLDSLPTLQEYLTESASGSTGECAGLSESALQSNL